MYFSVVIPLYNKEKHIKRAIFSVLKQTYNKFELIVVDDGSTDAGYCIAKEIKDKRIKLLKKKNGGVSSARNYGIKHANYEYIAFLDADDEWKPNFLEEIKKLIIKYPKAGAYATSYEFYKNDQSIKPKLNINMKSGEAKIINYFKGTLYQPLVSASSVTVHRTVFKNIGLFLEHLNRGEDLEMWCRIALNYDIAFINLTLSRYYLDAENRSNRVPRNYSNSFLSMVESLYYEEIKKGNKSKYFKEYMIKNFITLAQHLVDTGEHAEARKLLLKYRNTKYHKSNLIKTFLITFGLFRVLRDVKNKFK